MASANSDIYDKFVDRAAMLRLHERRVHNKIGVVLDDHEAALDDIVKSASNTTRGQAALLKDIDHEILTSYKKAYNTSASGLIELVGSQISFAYQGLEASLGKIWNVERPHKRVSEEIVLNRPLIGDMTLSSGWGNLGTGERKRIEAVIRRGLSEGRTYNEIALDVRRHNVVKISRNQSKGLVTTAITSITNQADLEVYEANADAIVGYQYIAILDARTTDICASRDGKIFPISDKKHLPPAHFYCRSRTVPVFKSWEQMSNENLAQVRKDNIKGLTKKQVEYYDGKAHHEESYNAWLLRQPREIQLKHLGSTRRVSQLNSGQLTVSGFTDEGNNIGARELNTLSNNFTPDGTTKRFAAARERLDSLHIGASRPEDFYGNPELVKNLKEYYKLQARELDGTLSLTNYRGTLIGNKKNMKRRVLNVLPREDQIIFNPITKRYEDVRLYQPNATVFANAARLLDESVDLKAVDKKFIRDFVDGLDGDMGMNERAVITDNLRNVFSRYRREGKVWGNFKAVTQNQIKFDVMNISDAIETTLRRDRNLLKRLSQSNFADPVLGNVSLQDLGDNLVSNIQAVNRWEDKVAPKIARELRTSFDHVIASEHPIIWNRLSERDLQKFYLRMANRLSLADTPDRDQLAVELGRDLFNTANYNGSRNEWFNLGLKILDSKKAKKFYEIETFGVQKRRMRSRHGGKYFGPYYDTIAYNIRITDPRIQEYAHLQRKVELGMRVPVVGEPKLIFRPGYKTYFVDRGILGLEDTRIPITSTHSFSDFPVEFIDKEMADALNWSSRAKYKIDKDYYDFMTKLMAFEDDKGKAKYFNDLNVYKSYIGGRSDSYERFKAMEWLKSKDLPFSNTSFIDHRARVYDRGLISPQAGETFRPFLNTLEELPLGVKGFLNYQDQVGSFLGGLNDTLEGRYNSLSFTGRQKIAEKWRKDMVMIGNKMMRGKPQDIRDILQHQMLRDIDGEDVGKFYRLAIETAKLDNYLGGDYSPKSIQRLNAYRTAFAMEQDASSSGAQIIALTTKNKQLAELSNVVPTAYKKRLYDEIAASTFNDPRFRALNEKLGLTEKDLRKAAKA